MTIEFAVETQSTESIGVPPLVDHLDHYALSCADAIGRLYL